MTPNISILVFSLISLLIQFACYSSGPLSNRVLLSAFFNQIAHGELEAGLTNDGGLESFSVYKLS